MNLVTTTMIYPWDKAKLSTDSDAYDFDLIKGNLQKLGFPAIVDNIKNPTLLSKINEILTHLNPTAEGSGKWLLVGSNNAEWLKILSLVVPMTYALSFRLPVHPIDADVLMNVFKSKEDAEETEDLPLGMYTLEGSSLVVFNNINVAPRFMRGYTSQSTRLFNKWLRPWVSVMGTFVFAGDYSKTASDYLIKSIGYNFGNTARFGFASRAEVFLVYDEKLNTRMPIRK